MKNVIQYIRETHNLTQDELALALNLSREFINKMENGKAEISLKTAALILEKYHINVNSFSQDGKNGSVHVTEESDEPIKLLIYNNTKLADAHLELATANRSLSDANAELVHMLKTNLNGSKENQLKLSFEIQKAFDKIARNGVPVWWSSMDEGLSILDKLFVGDAEEKRE